tara:strand:+ start:607 stop:2946 length:2340 start_codon:yes stop_codon:yes gene_type:complete
MSFYSLKYRLEFDDVIEGEFNDYRLEIRKKYEDGETPDSIVNLTGTNSPVVLNYNVTEDDILAVFRSSYLDISVYQTPEMVANQFSDLYLAQDDSFQVFLYKNNSKFWQGWIGASLIAIQQISPPYVVQIKAYDGLHLLKKKSFFDTNEVFQAYADTKADRYGYQTIKDIVAKCLYYTGLNGSTNRIYSLIRIRNQKDTASIFDDRYFLDDTKMHHTSFLKGESDAMTCFEVLEMILKSLALTIYQRDCSWCLVKISDMTQSDQANDEDWSCRSDYGWVTDNLSQNNYTTEFTEIVNSSAYTGDIDFFQIDGDGLITLQYPLQKVVVEQENDHNWITTNHIDSVNDLGASEPTGTLLFDEWVPEYTGSSGTDIQEAVVLRPNGYRTSAQNYDTNATNKNSESLPKSLIEADLGVFRFFPINQAACLKYPVSHDAIKKSYDQEIVFTDPAQTNYEHNPIKFTLKYRPLYMNQTTQQPQGLSDDKYIRVQMSPRFITTDGDYLLYDNCMSRVAESTPVRAAFLSRFNAGIGGSNWFRTFSSQTRKINEWQTQEAVSELFQTGTTLNDGTPASFAKLEFRIYGGYVWEDGDSDASGYTDLTDVTYTDISSYPTVTKYQFPPVKQEYTVEQLSEYAKTKQTTVKLGSNIVTTGKNCFISFRHIGGDVMLSFDEWVAPFVIGGVTLQHLVAFSYMMLYKIPVRRLDGSHYGNYKYGNKFVYDNGINGSTGKFFPMNAKMDLRNARTSFTADDLIDNYQTSYPSSNYPRKIKWMGKDDISEIEDY